MKDHKGKYPISHMAKKLEVSSSGFYSLLKRPVSNTKLRHEYLTEEIKRVFNQHNGNFGSQELPSSFMMKE